MALHSVRTDNELLLPQRLALDLYAAVLDGDGLPRVLDSIARALGADTHATQVAEFAGHVPLASQSMACMNIDPDDFHAYGTHWVRHDPWMKAAQAHGPGVLNMARVVPAETYARSAIWNEFCRPRGRVFHCLSAYTTGAGNAVGGLGLHRQENREPFGAAEESLLEELFPHLRRTMMLQSRLGEGIEAPVAATAGLDALRQGVAVLSEEGRLLFSNTALRDMAAQTDGFVLDHNGLYCPAAPARRALRHAIAAALAAARGQLRFLHESGSLAIPRPSGAAPWIVQVLPLRRGEHGAFAGFSGAMLLVSDPQQRATPSTALLRHLLDLTPAEAALAAALARGETLAAYAAGRRLSVETARTHLASIRRKTGCRRQADLVALLGRLGG
ncbi:helix-turn-helix transcriptional regulator [Roseomonas sp. BN140053]|uniref:helix-turn-helix transcriptional regulator n=1 Tax=Roseomonas sp. BN140053 TaxID=3391898 RepID=UPI0039EA4735